MISEKGAEDIKGKTKDDGDGSAVTVVLRAGLHCEGCAQKVKRSLLKHLDGVEKVKVNYDSKKVTVLGKVDPAKVKEKVEQKTKKPAHLLSPKPKPNKVKHTNLDENPVQTEPPVHPNKCDNINANEIKPQSQEVADADAGATFVLKTRVHCDNCVHKINKIIKKYEGVEDVNVDLEKDKITIKGKMDMEEMLPYLNTKLKRVVVIRSPPGNKADGGAGTEKSNRSKGHDGGEKKSKVDCEEKTEKRDEEKPETAVIKEEGKPKTAKIKEEEKPKTVNSKKAAEEFTESRIEVVNKMEYNGINGYEYGTHTYDPQQVQGKGYVVEYWNAPNYTDAPTPYYFHAPQMFSDENPNAACFIMYKVVSTFDISTNWLERGWRIIHLMSICICKHTEYMMCPNAASNTQCHLISEFHVVISGLTPSLCILTNTWRVSSSCPCFSNVSIMLL
ncbi:hypothetical protein V2J09_006621 [Rumex salicifolius]